MKFALTLLALAAIPAFATSTGGEFFDDFAQPDLQAHVLVVSGCLERRRLQPTTIAAAVDVAGLMEMQMRLFFPEENRYFHCKRRHRRSHHRQPPQRSQYGLS